MADSGAAAAITPPAATPPAAPPSAGAQIASDHWAAGFKNQELKTYVSDSKKFASPEALAESYKSLEAKFSQKYPEDRMILLPEKPDDASMRAVYEKLGAPKEAKEYGIPRDEKGPDPKFAEWAEGQFHKAGLSKAQASALAEAYNGRNAEHLKEFQTNRGNAIKQADDSLKKEWGGKYEENINTVKQGAKILGLDAQTLDMLETVQGREKLYKNLQRIGVSVAEDKFIDGGNQSTTAPTKQEAEDRLKALGQDRKFVKKLNRGDADALKEITRLNQIIWPGDKAIG